MFELEKHPEILLYTSLDKGNTLPYDTAKILLKRPVKTLQRKRNMKDAQRLFNSKECIRQGTQMAKYRQVGATAQSLTPLGQNYIHWCSALSVWSYSLWTSEIAGTCQKRQRNSSRQICQRAQHRHGEVWDQTLHSKNLKTSTTQPIKELGQDF